MKTTEHRSVISVIAGLHESEVMQLAAHAIARLRALPNLDERTGELYSLVCWRLIHLARKYPDRQDIRAAVEAFYDATNVGDDVQYAQLAAVAASQLLFIGRKAETLAPVSNALQAFCSLDPQAACAEHNLESSDWPIHTKTIPWMDERELIRSIATFARALYERHPSNVDNQQQLLRAQVVIQKWTSAWGVYNPEYKVAKILAHSYLWSMPADQPCDLSDRELAEGWNPPIMWQCIMLLLPATRLPLVRRCCAPWSEEKIALIQARMGDPVPLESAKGVFDAWMDGARAEPNDWASAIAFHATCM